MTFLYCDLSSWPEIFMAGFIFTSGGIFAAFVLVLVSDIIHDFMKPMRKEDMQIMEGVK